MIPRSSGQMCALEPLWESTALPALRCNTNGTKYVARCHPLYSRATGCGCAETAEASHRLPTPRIEIQLLNCSSSLQPFALWYRAANVLGEVSGHLLF